MCKKLQCFLLIILFYFFLLLLSSLGWLLNITIPFAFLPLAVLASILVVTLYNNKWFDKKTAGDFVLNLFLLSALTGLAVIPSLLIFDNSYDGQTYHYETQAAILNGWNPVKHQLTNGTQNILFINHYAKGFETGAAYFWSFFRNPESGKALNIMMLAACFFYVSYLLQELKIFTKSAKLFFVALLIALNPITVCQLFTYYVDGQIAALITMLISSLYLFMKKRSSLHLVIAVIVFCLMGDIKFTGLIYGIAIFGLFGLWMLFKKMNILRLVIAGFTAFVITLFIIGFNPYVTNCIQQSNPFYPLAGKNKIDIITAVQPLSFAGKNAFQKFSESNFSQSHNIHGHKVTPEPKLKIPFTFSVNEWLVFKGSECRIAGYGPLFGGILLISFIIFLIAILKMKSAVLNEDAFIISLLIMLTLLINPEMWMSRYVPQLWLFPFCMTWLFRRELIFKKISRFLLIVLSINIAGIMIVNWGVAVLISYKMHKELEWLKEMNTPVHMVTKDFIAAKERIKFYGMQVIEVKRESEDEYRFTTEYVLQNSQATVYLLPGTPVFENTGILKLLDKKLE